MKPSKRKGLRRVWMGAVGAIGAAWLTLALLVWVSFRITKLDPAPGIAYFPSTRTMILLLWLWAAAFPIISFIMALVCTFFWPFDTTEVERERWGFWLLSVAFAPLFLLYGVGLLVFLPSLFVLYHALDWGAQWWKRRRYRQFLGLANDYERDSDAKL